MDTVNGTETQWETRRCGRLLKTNATDLLIYLALESDAYRCALFQTEMV
jgi:hypothetical protein